MFCLRRLAAYSRPLIVLSRAAPARTMHLSTRWRVQEKKPTARTSSTANELSELILRRLHFREQRGLVKALIIGSGIVIVSTVLFLYVFRTPLKNQTVAQVADVAKSSLEQGKTPEKRNETNRSVLLCRDRQTTGERPVARIDPKSSLRSDDFG